MPPAHLLAIPRELRDNIYKYLYHSIRVEWRWEYVGSERCKPSEAQLDNVPLLDVLLIHPQIYHEYYEASLRSLSATIDWCYGIKGLPEEVHPIVPAPGFDLPFGQLRHVTLLMTNAYYSHNPYYSSIRPAIWEKVTLLAEMLHHKASHLATLRIIFCDEVDADRSENEILRANYPYIDRTGDEKFELIESILATPPESLAGLPLAYRGHGHYLESTCREYIGSLAGIHGPPEWETTPRLDWGIHAVYRTAQYIYTYATHTTFTAPTEFWDAWDGPKYYPDGLLKGFEEADAIRIRGRERRMLEWKVEAV